MFDSRREQWVEVPLNDLTPVATLKVVDRLTESGADDISPAEAQDSAKKTGGWRELISPIWPAAAVLSGIALVPAAANTYGFIFDFNYFIAVMFFAFSLLEIRWPNPIASHLVR